SFKRLDCWHGAIAFFSSSTTKDAGDVRIPGGERTRARGSARGRRRARQSGAVRVWRGDRGPARGADRGVRPLPRPPHQQFRRILRADRGAELCARAQAPCLAGAERFRADGQADEWGVQGAQSGAASAVRRSEAAGAAVEVVPHRARPPRAQCRCRSAGQSSDGPKSLTTSTTETRKHGGLEELLFSVSPWWITFLIELA